MKKAIFLCLGLVTASGCASEGPPPSAPSRPTFTTPDAPSLPRLPQPPGPLASLSLTPPRLPKARFQRVEEVLPDGIRAVSTPASLPLQKGDLVVLALPERANSVQVDRATQPEAHDLVRCSLASAFLKHGFALKDAGSFAEINYSVNLWPTSRHLEPEKASDKTPKTDGSSASPPTPKADASTRTWDSWRRYWDNYGLKLRFRDPLSIWGPGILSHAGLESKYLLRVYRYRLSRFKREVQLGQVRDAADLKRFERDVTSYNEEVEAFNRRRARHQRLIAAYRQKHAAAKRRYDDQHRRYVQEFTRARQNALQQYNSTHRVYVSDFKRWVSKAPAQRNRQSPQPRAEASTFAQPAAPSAVGSPQRVDLPDEKPTISGETLLARGGKTLGQKVNLWGLSFMAELVEAGTGKVVWVGRAAGYFSDRFDVQEVIADSLLEKLSPERK